MIYFALLAMPLLAGPFRDFPNGKWIYRYFVACYFILLILFSGLRWNTGTDWANYHQYFIDRDNTLLSFEAGYVWFTDAVKAVTNSYTAFLLIDSLLALIPVWYVLQVENDADPISLCVFFSYYYTINYLGSNRRIIACGLCLLALLALRQKKLLLFIGLCFASFFFHRSSLIFLLAWPIYRMRPRLRTYFALVLLAVLFLALNPFKYLAALGGGATEFVLVNKVLGYADNNSLDPNINYGVQNTISIIKRSAFLALIFWGWSKQPEETKSEYTGFLNLYVFSFVCYIMFTGTVELFKTLTVYFSVVELFLIPRALFCIDKKFRPIAYVLFCLVLVAQQYSALNSYWELFVPYKSALSWNVH